MNTTTAYSSCDRTLEGYEFHCSAPDCTEYSHDVEDFLKCEGCGQLVCAGHAHKPANYAGMSYCADCFRCVVCRGPALAQCEECGEMICGEHSEKTFEAVDDWNRGDEHYFCSGLCREDFRKPMKRETESNNMQEPTMPVSQVEKLVRVLMALERKAAVVEYHDKRPADAYGMYRIMGRVMADNGLTLFREL